MKTPHHTCTQNDIEKQLQRQARVLVRRGAPAPETDPFKRYAKSVGFAPPIDAEARLRAMRWKGRGGGTAIHQTQLQVTASLLQAGLGEDEVVERVLYATREATEGRPDWNWDHEEQVIRGMCTSWQKKHPPKPEKKRKPPPKLPNITTPLIFATGEPNELVDGLPTTETQVDRRDDPEPGGAQIHSLAVARAERDLKKGGKRGDKNTHVVLARGLLDALKERGEQIIYEAGRPHRCRGGLWEAMSAEEEKTWLSTLAQEGCNALELASRNNLVSEVIGWIRRQPELHRDKIDWDSHGKIPTLSGLVDPITWEVTPLRPEHYATYRIECLYDPEAACPWWQQMLKDCLPDKATIDVVQEVMGTALIENKPRELTRAMVLVGPSNSGKSNLLNAMAGFLSAQAITVSFDGLDNAHGLMPFLRRAPWLLHEAFEQSKWQFSAIVKALLSGDPVGVNIKSGPIVTHRFRSPVFWGSNSRPQFKEASKARTKRMIVQPCTKVFSDEKPVGAAKEAYKRGYPGPADMVLDTERSGMLNWALAGLRRALVRGHFDLTPEMKAILHEIQQDANYIEGFMEECTEYDETKRISMANYCAAHGAWWKNHHGDARPMPSNDAIGKALRDLGDAKLKFKKIGSRRYIIGIRLNENGMAWWTAAFCCRNLAFTMSKTSNISQRPEDVEEDATK